MTEKHRFFVNQLKSGTIALRGFCKFSGLTKKKSTQGRFDSNVKCYRKSDYD